MLKLEIFNLIFLSLAFWTRESLVETGSIGGGWSQKIGIFDAFASQSSGYIGKCTKQFLI